MCGSAKDINQSEDESQYDYEWHKAAPDEPLDHVFGFEIERASRAAARGLRKHVATVATGFCAHCHWFTGYTTLLVHIGMNAAQGKFPDESPDPGRWLDDHGDYLFKYAVFRLRDNNAAEDAVQETFLAALKAYKEFEGRASERTWLVGILKHKIVDHFRRAGREAPLGEESDEGPDHREFFERPEPWQGHWNNNYAPNEWHATPAELIERNDFWKVFNDCLSPLPQRTASAFTLREVDGLKSEEICDILSIKVNNLWVMLHRARLHLRNCLELNWFRREE